MSAGLGASMLVLAALLTAGGVVRPVVLYRRTAPERPSAARKPQSRRLRELAGLVPMCSAFALLLLFGGLSGLIGGGAGLGVVFLAGLGVDAVVGAVLLVRAGVAQRREDAEVARDRLALGFSAPRRLWPAERVRWVSIVVAAVLGGFPIIFVILLGIVLYGPPSSPAASSPDAPTSPGTRLLLTVGMTYVVVAAVVVGGLWWRQTRRLAAEDRRRRAEELHFLGTGEDMT